MNWIDLLLVLIFMLAAWGGWRRGFIRGSLDLVTWLGSIALGFAFYSYTANGVYTLVKLDAWLFPVSFIITAAAAGILISIIIKRILLLIPEKTNTNTVNRLLGIVPGVINGLIGATVIVAFLLTLPLRKNITAETQKSQIAETLSVQAGWANKKLAPVFDRAVRQTMNSLSSHPSGSHEEVDLHFTYDNPTVRPALEEQMLEMINKERAKEGLKPLKADPQETMVARAHSKDMFARGYFAHENPEGKDPFDRMKEAKVRFTTAGENLALAQTLAIAHSNLMNSPGHRANIMNPAFGRIGIGIMDGGFYGIMISQEFRN
jgi:uncharacterized protein YkwD